MAKNVWKGFVLAILAGLLWGLSATFGQFLLQQRGMNPEWLVTVRLLISGVILLGIALFQKNSIQEIWKNKKDALQLVVFSLFGVLATQYTYFAAIQASNAPTATVLQYLCPVMIAIYLALSQKKTPTALGFLTILLAVGGTFLLVTHGNIQTLSISPVAFFWGITSAIALAIYSMQPIRLLKKYSSQTVIGWGMLIGGLAFSFVHAPWNPEGSWDLYTYLFTAFIIFGGSLIAFSAYLIAVKYIGPQKSSLIATLEPLSATIFSVLWLHTSFQALDWIGALCILSTIFLLTLTKTQKM